tara:strand:+ start:343 stop:690 length:348 start_codon:yes stop_codon:yes gene_type:complete
MKIDELKATLDSLTSDLDNIENGDALYTIKSNASEISSYSEHIEDEVSNVECAINEVRSQLNSVVDNLIEGFDVEAVRKAVKEEIISELTNLLSDLLTDGLKKAPAKKSTETDNQ